MPDALSPTAASTEDPTTPNVSPLVVVNDASITYQRRTGGRSSLLVCHNWGTSGCASGTGSLSSAQNSASKFGWSDTDATCIRAIRARLATATSSCRCVAVSTTTDGSRCRALRRCLGCRDVVLTTILGHEAINDPRGQARRRAYDRFPDCWSSQLAMFRFGPWADPPWFTLIWAALSVFAILFVLWRHFGRTAGGLSRNRRREVGRGADAGPGFGLA